MKNRNETVKFVFQGIVFQILVLIVAAVLAFVAYNTKLSEAMQERVYRLLADSAEAQRVTMEERVESSLQQLDIIAASIDWSKDIYSDAETLRQLKKLSKESQFVNAAIGTTDGRLLYQNGKIAYCADRPYYKNAMNGKTSAQFLSKGRMSGESVFVFAVPAYSEGKVIGTVVATRNLSDISRELGGIKSSNNQQNFLCDSAGNFVAVPTEKKLHITLGGNVGAYFKSTDTDIKENKVSEYTYEGKKYFGIYVKSGLDNIYIFSVTTAAYASNLAGLYSRLGIYTTIVIFAIAVLASAIVIIKLIRRVNAANALETERRKKLEEYHEFLNKRSLEFADAVGTYYLNVTRNECGNGRPVDGTGESAPKWQSAKTVDDFCNSVAEYIHPSDREEYRRCLSRKSLAEAFESGKATVSGEFLFYAHKERYVWIRVVADLMRDPLTDDLEALTYALNINHEKRLEQIGQKLICESIEAMGLIDVRSQLVFGVKAIGKKRILEKYELTSGVKYDEVALKTLSSLLSRRDFEYIQKNICLDNVTKELEKAPNYSLTTHLSNGNAESDGYYRVSFSYLDGKKESIVVSCENVTDILLSRMDVETGLYNLTGFREKVGEWLEANPGKHYRIYRYNVDGFNNINAVYGYDEGNRLLREIGEKMRSRNTDDSFAAHISDDHFVRFCSEDYLSAEECYARFVKDFADYPLDYPILMHVGVYDLCEEGCDLMMMMYKAYLALQSVKDDFAHNIAYYSAGLMQATEKEQQLLSEVKDAVEGGQLEVWFQPQYNYKGVKLIGAEALVRWRHPEMGLIPPSEFVPLLERSKQITLVDRYVWRNVCRYIRLWKDKGVELSVSVNVSRVDIRDAGICEALEEYVREFDISPSMLKIEITESAYMNETKELKAAVKAFKKAGFIVEMDDFGAGYSSLNILKELDIDILKLDMKLVSEIGGSNKKSDVIIRAVIEMARSLNIDIIAEGVETEEQAKFLMSLGCSNMQGYYFGKPMCVKDFEGLIGVDQG